MTPVDQTDLGRTTGNCFSACVASILEIPLDDVPFFMDREDWWPKFARWCAGRGITPIHFQAAEYVPSGYAIAGGPSPARPDDYEYHHACVALDGNVVHDPHPARLGLPEIHDYVVLEQAT